MKIDYLSLLFTIAVFLAAVSCCVYILVRIIRSLIVFAHKVEGGGMKAHGIIRLLARNGKDHCQRPVVIAMKRRKNEPQQCQSTDIYTLLR